MNNNKKLLGLLRFSILVLFLGPAQAQSPSDSVITMDRGTHKLLRDTGIIKRVAVGDPAIADVNIINRRELLITGKAPGVTSLIIWPESAPTRPRNFSLRVLQPAALAPRPDPELARAQIEPGKGLQGSLPNLLAHRRAKIDAANGAQQPISDLSSVAVGTQVMTEVKIAEISRNTLQQFGFNFFKSVGNTFGAVTAPGGAPTVSFPKYPYSQPRYVQNAEGTPIPNPLAGQSNSTFGIEGALVPLQNAFALVYGNPVDGLLGVLSVLQQNGMARVLAEPTLLATSGQTANYLAGGEFPVPVSQGGATAGGISIEYKEFGVRLAISPTVLSRDRIALKIAPEVSDLDFSAGIQIGGVAVPALTVRRTDTTIELGDGESFVISGLVSSNLLNNVSKVPWLGDLPVIGAFFRSTSINRQDKELVMIVTPHLVRPLARGGSRPKLPGADYDDYDPSFAHTMLLENGDFNTGFSR